jgi:hypothetical protein
MRLRTLALSVAFIVALAPARLTAQSGDRLEAAELAADAGDLARARAYLQDWLSSEAASAPDAEVGRALVLRARLAESADSAEVDYVDAAVRGDQEYGALARLRLAQLRLLDGRPALADSDLAQLRTDFPDSPLVPESWLWTGFVLESLGEPASACAAWENIAGGAAADPIVAQANDGLAGCRAGTPGGDTRSRFTVQLGAFGSRQAAEDVRRRAMGSGSGARIVEPNGTTPLYRVRVGQFSRREDAARQAVALRSEGFEAIVVPEIP